VSPVDRLAGSRGWVRSDGHVVYDQVADLMMQRSLYPRVARRGGALQPDLRVDGNQWEWHRRPVTVHGLDDGHRSDHDLFGIDPDLLRRGLNGPNWR